MGDTEEFGDWELSCITTSICSYSSVRTGVIPEMEKQIPKKVAYQEYQYHGTTIRTLGIDGVPYDLCPGGRCNLCTAGFFGRGKMKFWPDGGQAIDWRTSEE